METEPIKLTDLEALLCDELVDLKHEYDIVKDLYDLSTENNNVSTLLYIHATINLLINPYNSLVRRSKLLGVNDFPVVGKYLDYLKEGIGTLQKDAKTQYEYYKLIAGKLQEHE
jgi:hypothetical protein